MGLAVVTSNPHKAKEVAAFFDGELEIERVNLECPEFGNLDVGEIAKGKAQFAYDELERPLIGDDTAFSVKALRGFPGPTPRMSSIPSGTRASSGSSKERRRGGPPSRPPSPMLTRQEYRSSGVDRRGNHPVPRGREGFGYDPIFEVDGKTLAESASKRRAGSPTGRGRWPHSVSGGGRKGFTRSQKEPISGHPPGNSLRSPPPLRRPPRGDKDIIRDMMKPQLRNLPSHAPVHCGGMAAPGGGAPQEPPQYRVFSRNEFLIGSFSQVSAQILMNPGNFLLKAN